VGVVGPPISALSDALRAIAVLAASERLGDEAVGLSDGRGGPSRRGVCSAILVALYDPETAEPGRTGKRAMF
jgi:hypothetical protein